MDVDPLSALKRCSSAPQINNLAPRVVKSSIIMASTQTPNSSSKISPMPSSFNIFTPRARRHSASFSPLARSPGPRLTPRVSQLRQEECADVNNSREVTHERGVHDALQMSQSWEDLTICTDSWSFKNTNEAASMSNNPTDLMKPLHLSMPTSTTGAGGAFSCSSPSPTSRTGMRVLPYGLSPSPTRRTPLYTTRRSMSPIAMRPSSLGQAVKRKFAELDEQHMNSCSPPAKRIFGERDTLSPHSRQSPTSSVCPSPDGLLLQEGRITPKMFQSKLCTNSSSSLSSSPSAAASPMTEGSTDSGVVVSSSDKEVIQEQLDDDVVIADKD